MVTIGKFLLVDAIFDPSRVKSLLLENEFGEVFDATHLAIIQKSPNGSKNFHFMANEVSLHSGCLVSTRSSIFLITR